MIILACVPEASLSHALHNANAENYAICYQNNILFFILLISNAYLFYVFHSTLTSVLINEVVIELLSFYGQERRFSVLTGIVSKFSSVTRWDAIEPCVSLSRTQLCPSSFKSKKFFVSNHRNSAIYT